MGIIIGAATSVDFEGACVISANWSYSPNTQRVYCLNGSWDPNEELTKNRPTKSVNIVCYSPGPNYTTTPSTTCTRLATVASLNVAISPGGCDVGGSSDAGGLMMPTGYSWSREDSTMPGQESWSLMTYLPTEPTYVIRGIAEGFSCSYDGITIESPIAGSSGNITAGPTSIGRADTVNHGQVSKVGGGTSTGVGTGQGQASIPYTPLWL